MIMKPPKIHYEWSKEYDVDATLKYVKDVGGIENVPENVARLLIPFYAEQLKILEDGVKYTGKDVWYKRQKPIIKKALKVLRKKDSKYYEL